MDENGIATAIIDAAMKLHTCLGPGLLESVYETAMMIELQSRGFVVKRQVPIEVEYEGRSAGIGFRADMIVADKVLIELKSVESITPVFKKTTLSYLKMGNWHLGYLINFNVNRLKDGITRIVNGLPDTHTD